MPPGTSIRFSDAPTQPDGVLDYQAGTRRPRPEREVLLKSDPVRRSVAGRYRDKA